MPTKQDAEDLLLLVGRRQYQEHPEQPGRPWLKITLDGALDFKPYLDMDDLGAVTTKLQQAWHHIQQRNVCPSDETQRPDIISAELKASCQLTPKPHKVTSGLKQARARAKAKAKTVGESP